MTSLLSEQELVDCDTGYNMGCNGGLMDYAFEFIINNGGMDSEEDYPYRGVDDTCDQYKKNATVVSIDSYENVNSYNELALKKAVANQPVSVAIEGGGREFQLYSSGVFTGRCGTAMDHGVVAVGYAIGVVEGINKIVTGEMTSLLSEQELVDCDTGYNMGCNGGLMDYAFEFIINNGGTEEDYPYRGVDGTCDQYKKNAKVVSIDSYEHVNFYDELALKKAVANQPVSVAIEGGGREFQLYSSGVFTGRCGTAMDHGVVAVGYVTKNGHHYWIVRNSWGADWGERRIHQNRKKSGYRSFSAIGVVEGINKIVTGEMTSLLSEQELVDCDTGYNMGCNGGLMDYASEFIINNGGTEEDYPYRGVDGTCDQYKKNAKVVSIDSYEHVNSYDELALKKAVANQPVSVAIEGGGREFQLYSSVSFQSDFIHDLGKKGVFTGRCGTAMDHGVVAVGYGTKNGHHYWIVRNSWGADWGERRIHQNGKKSGYRSFSAIGVVEGINKIVTGEMTSLLSEQELVDCDTGYNMGCKGGLMDYAFEFIINNGGTEEDYPYRGVDGTCDQYKKNAKVVSIDSYEHVNSYDELALKKAVANQPGVFTGRCGTAMDHGVVAVGYVTKNGHHYWIVRNSWGADWGERRIHQNGKKSGYRSFSAIGVVEGINKIVTGEMTSLLSEQELVDCDTGYNMGCNGGLMDYAFEFIINNGGTEEDYPFRGVDGTCDQYKKNAKVVSIDSYEHVNSYDELALKKAVANQPVSVAIEGGGREFQLYSSVSFQSDFIHDLGKKGVFTGRCGTAMDHGVVAVGYGTKNGHHFWIVRNSWGADWGERRIHQNGKKSGYRSFSAIGVVEGINKIVTGEMTSLLSEQELVDCDTGYNMGCNGGLMDYASEFIIKNRGTEEDYPYRGVDGTCDQYKKNAKVVSIDSYEHVNSYDELALKKAVANQPVSVAIEGGGRKFQLYSSVSFQSDFIHDLGKKGVFTGRCGTAMDHGVVAVGYGTKNGHHYWIVRNSWGADWGERRIHQNGKKSGHRRNDDVNHVLPSDKERHSRGKTKNEELRLRRRYCKKEKARDNDDRSYVYPKEVVKETGNGSSYGRNDDGNHVHPSDKEQHSRGKTKNEELCLGFRYYKKEKGRDDDDNSYVYPKEVVKETGNGSSHRRNDDGNHVHPSDKERHSRGKTKNEELCL
ncbi:hypothetical protein V8G54_002890 [Vigna mungo]|uniref:Peptidase C1A papain C-terminal domain-containing protein n=1 Tax=Vigna mungo TaxID=3915 RepID=A0AAQ3SD38_VIGMU